MKDCTDFLREKYDFVCEVLSSLSVAEEDKDEVTNEILYILWKHYDRLGEIENFEGWAYIVIKNTVLKMNVKADRHKCQFSYMDDIGIEGIDSSEYVDVRHRCHIEHGFCDRGLLEHINSLTEPGRSIIKLYYGDGYKIHEIAKLLGMKENTVKTVKKRSVESLKKILENDRGDGENLWK